ncbi:biopolymer transporter Tol [Nesterenkonia halotolerans]|uniref:biopolymer transporter Tol n=1 Tax=Nesterenkonia halotolerans TaxID=225325 RepID=UPI003EE76AD7
MAEDAEPAESAEEESARWLVIKGRRWRRTDPALPAELEAKLKSHLGRGRSAVGAGKKTGDDERVARARKRVNLAKTGLGERGPYWWERDESARLEAARAAVAELDGLPE